MVLQLDLGGMEMAAMQEAERTLARLNEEESEEKEIEIPGEFEENEDETSAALDADFNAAFM